MKLLNNYLKILQMKNKEKDNLSVKQFLDSLTSEELEALLINYNDIVPYHLQLAEGIQ